VSRQDRSVQRIAIQPALQRSIATRLNAAVVEVASSHVAMLSHPREVASLIAG
jgi:hypothetical protein